MARKKERTVSKPYLWTIDWTLKKEKMRFLAKILKACLTEKSYWWSFRWAINHLWFYPNNNSQNWSPLSSTLSKRLRNWRRWYFPSDKVPVLLSKIRVQAIPPKFLITLESNNSQFSMGPSSNLNSYLRQQSTSNRLLLTYSKD